MKQYRFILVRPQYPSNMGSAARALHALDIGDLVFVDPGRDPLAERALKLAREGISLLESARIFTSVADAIQDCDYVIATSGKVRGGKIPCISSFDLENQIQKIPLAKKVAVLFGTESSGLANHELELADCIVSIQTTELRSLNLAQTVMIMAHELARTQTRQEEVSETSIHSSEDSLAALKRRIESLPLWQQFPKTKFALLRQCNGFNGEHVKLAHRVIDQVSHQISRLE